MNLLSHELATPSLPISSEQNDVFWGLLPYAYFIVVVEKKRIQRMKRAGKDKPTMETYESLVSDDILLSCNYFGLKNSEVCTGQIRPCHSEALKLLTYTTCILLYGQCMLFYHESQSNIYF